MNNAPSGRGGGANEPSALSLLVNAADRDGPGSGGGTSQQQQQQGRNGSANPNADPRLQELHRLREAAGLGVGKSEFVHVRFACERNRLGSGIFISRWGVLAECI